MTTPVVVGLDLSLTASGAAWFADGRGVAVTIAGAGRDLARLRMVRQAVTSHCRNADLVVVEGLAFASETGKAHDRAGLWWLVRDRLDLLRRPVAVVPPATLKVYGTGRGNAGKTMVVAAVVQRWRVVPADDNQADATVLAAMGMDHLGCPPASVPQSHRRALEKVVWP